MGVSGRACSIEAALLHGQMGSSFTRTNSNAHNKRIEACTATIVSAWRGLAPPLDINRLYKYAVHM